MTLRRKHGLYENSFILIYVGEFIDRKNHKFVIQSLAEMKMKIPNLVVLFAGRGKLLEEMKKLTSDLAVSDIVYFLGFREDVNEFMQLADVGISASKQEGLGLNLAEEMFCGLPIVATDDRGHRELVDHNENGFIFAQGVMSDFTQCVFRLYSDKDNRNRMARNSLHKAKKFSLANSLSSMTEIYYNILVNKQ
jgi:glycosyltransferase EpsD